MTNNGEHYRASLDVVGVKKRCRKTARHRFNLGYYPLTAGLDDLRPKINQVLVKDMKESIKARLSLDLVEVLGEGAMVRWSPFDEKTKAHQKEFDLNVNEYL